MLLDETRINELVEKEVKEQVEKKLKTIRRQAIKDIYGSVIRTEVIKHIIELKEETAKELNLMIESKKDDWKQEVLEYLKSKLDDKLDRLFTVEEDDWDY